MFCHPWREARRRYYKYRRRVALLYQSTRRRKWFTSRESLRKIEIIAIFKYMHCIALKYACLNNDLIWRDASDAPNEMVVWISWFLTMLFLMPNGHLNASMKWHSQNLWKAMRHFRKESSTWRIRRKSIITRAEISEETVEKVQRLAKETSFSHDNRREAITKNRRENKIENVWEKSEEKIEEKHPE